MAVHKWSNIKTRSKLSPKRIAEIEREAEQAFRTAFKADARSAQAAYNLGVVVGRRLAVLTRDLARPIGAE